MLSKYSQNHSSWRSAHQFTSGDPGSTTWISEIQPEHPIRSRFLGRSTAPSQPSLPGVCLSANSDSGAIGDAKTSFAVVTLVGQTSANATVVLRGTGLTTTADAKGKFLFANLPLTLGDNELTVVAKDAAESSSSTTTIQRVEADNVTPVVEWNANALKAILTAGTPPPAAARNLAIVHVAMYDAANSIVDQYQPYRINLNAPADASVNAAAVGAAYRVLSKLYPNQKTTFDAALTASLAKIPDGRSEAEGLTVGQTVADSILAERSTDGAGKTVAYIPSTAPGMWRPSSPDFKPAALPQWGKVTPFAMTTGSQFRPGPPPKITSKQCAEELNQVLALGRRNSRVRTADQTEIAIFWADGADTFTPPGHWNQIAEQIAAEQQNTTLKDARLFALMNIALADAGIAAWDCKYTYNSWRPIDAIHLAGSDGNRGTKAAPQWNPLISTPNHPDYVSGHSTFSGAASEVLTSLFGDRFSFSTASIGLPGVSRSYNSFRQAANEAGISRIYGGIHTQAANIAGKVAGRKIAGYVVKNLMTPV
jgi:hypothetical protein